MNPTYVGYLWCALAALASATSTFLIKMSSQGEAGLNFVRLAYLGSACASYGLGFIFYTFALQRLQISLAYPVMTAVTMALVTAVGTLMLQEALTPTKIAGLLLVTAGAFVLAR
jgi:small multidrug resistance pump